ncbi:MAG: hypothetical protein DMG06_22195 [Acidobacteria bacterium]|nr:MAG: hypothetical protein DMG06_22195 [Acidobacteriota bacterium]
MIKLERQTQVDPRLRSFPVDGGAPRKLHLRRTIFVAELVLLLLFFSILSFAARKNPIEATADSIAKGQVTYKKNCQMCHGEKGMGDGPAGQRLNPRPRDFTDKSKMEKMTDEEMFKDITKGEGPMPAFEHKLSETDRWHVINYVRTFATGETK